MDIQFEFDGLPPSSNQLFPTSKSGHRFKSDKYKAFQELMSISVRLMKPKAPLLGDLKVEYDFYWPDKRRRDIANLEKALSDTLTDLGFWSDDSQIQTLHMERHIGPVATVVRISQP